VTCKRKRYIGLNLKQIYLQELVKILTSKEKNDKKPSSRELKVTFYLKRFLSKKMCQGKAILFSNFQISNVNIDLTNEKGR